MAIAAEGAAAHSQVEIVQAAKSPAVLELLGGYSCQHAADTCTYVHMLHVVHAPTTKTSNPFSFPEPAGSS